LPLAQAHPPAVPDFESVKQPMPRRLMVVEAAIGIEPMNKVLQKFSVTFHKKGILNRPEGS